MIWTKLLHLSSWTMCSCMYSPWCIKCFWSQRLSIGIKFQMVSFDTSHFQIGTCKATTFPRGMQGSKPFQLVSLSFLYLLELPPCMIWSKLSHSMSSSVHDYHFVHTPCGKLSPCHASFVILWSTLLIAQLVSSLISNTCIMIHETNSLGY